MECKICGNAEGNKTHEAREMMFGLRGNFAYFQCSQCGCLQISEIPADMSKYYPANYYSFHSRPDAPINLAKKLIKRIRDNYAIFNQGLLGRLLYVFFPYETLRVLSRIRLTKDSAILDVGCGSGDFLYTLRENGFRNLLGIDPFIEKNIEYKNGLRILKQTISDAKGIWDLIMFHHSFEHLPNPLEILQSVSKLLNKGGVCLIRIPTVPCYAWEHYRENWVQLDAPRHFFIHSPESIKILAGQAGFRLGRNRIRFHRFPVVGKRAVFKRYPA